MQHLMITKPPSDVLCQRAPLAVSRFLGWVNTGAFLPSQHSGRFTLINALPLRGTPATTETRRKG